MNPVLKDKLELFKKLFPTELIKTIDEKQGAEHYILDINNKWICKISKNVGSCLLELEVKVLQLLHGKLKTKIPVVVYYEPHFLVYKKVSGTELTPQFYEFLNSVQKDRLAYDIAFFLHELHNSVSLEDAEKLGVTRNNWPWSAEQLQHKAHLIEDRELKEVFKKFITEYSEFRKEDVIRIIHNDMILRNIIIDEPTGQLSGVIDFTDVALDDPYIDLRLNYMSISELSESIAHHYTRLAQIPLNLKKIYGYYMATEFSRYVQHREEQKVDELSIIKNRIMSSLSLFLH
jgi:aminoglycoside phosphotransferase (APT) family kinase protein